MTNWKQVLTEKLLGECWHLTGGGVSEDLMNFRCSACGEWLHFADIEIGCQRTFTTPQDVFDCKDKLVETGKWFVFFKQVRNEWKDSLNYSFGDYDEDDYPEWLFRTTNEQGEPHFCKLVYDCGVELGWWEESAERDLTRAIDCIGGE